MAKLPKFPEYGNAIIFDDRHSFAIYDQAQNKYDAEVNKYYDDLNNLIIRPYYDSTIINSGDASGINTMSKETKELESQIVILEKKLKDAVEGIRTQQQFIESLKEAPMSTGLLIRKADSFGIVATSSGLVHIKIPDKDTNGNRLKCEVGCRVKILAETGAIVDAIPSGSPLEILAGKIGTVKQIAGDICEIETDSGVVAALLNGKRPDKGDRVIIDENGWLVLHNFGKAEDSYKPDSSINVPWSDIGGCENAKRVLIEAIEDPIAHSELYKGYGQRVTKGVLLYGPPGTGKTLLGKAVATSLASLYGKEVSTGFIYVKGPEILSKWVGESEGTVRSFFARAREHHKNQGYPAVIFIDEADAILMSRGGHGRHLSGMEDTIVPMFLSEMDGMDSSSAFVILATNRPDMLDRAIVREGRIDRRVKIERPNPETAAEILKIHLAGKPMNKKFTEEDFIAITVEALFKDTMVVLRANTGAGEVPVKASSFISGAMLEGIVQRSVAGAIYRDKTARAKKPSGICGEDLVKAITNAIQELQNIDHSGELFELSEELGVQIKAVRKVAVSI